MFLFTFGFFLFTNIYAVPIPFIHNVSFVAKSSANNSIVRNVTCSECLCLSSENNALAFNCFINNQTCEFLYTFPHSYEIRRTVSSKLYFPKLIFPDPSRCCMPNLTDLAQRYRQAPIQTISTSSPRCLVIDNNHYLVTVQDGGSTLRRYNQTNLQLIDSTTFSGTAMMNIAYFSEAYYITLTSTAVLVVTSVNLTNLGSIYVSGVLGARDIIFLREGSVMILVSADNNKLIFFNRTGAGKHQYSFTYSLNTDYATPHGLWYGNDTFFQVASWNTKLIYSYSMNNSGQWNMKVFSNSVPSSGYGSHILVDECERRWLSLYTLPTFMIYDSNGTIMTSITLNNIQAFDMLLTDDYILFISDLANGKIHRIAPNITCLWTPTEVIHSIKI